MNGTIAKNLFFFLFSRGFMPNNILPLGASTIWTSETLSSYCNGKVASWLYDHNSLTEKLEASYSHFSVKVKQQFSVKPSKHLSALFNSEEKILVREVFLYCDHKPVVFAQTEIPYSTLTEEQEKLIEIGDQSLGKILFQDPTMLRGQIEVTEFKNGSPFHQLSAELKQPVEHSLWARRSLFYLNNKPLLVSELFLPASGIYYT